MYRISKKAWFRRLGYEPHTGQQPIHDSTARFRVVVAGRRWGKSLSASKEAEVPLLLPNTRGWVVSKTYDLATKVAREIYFDMIKKAGLTPTRKQMQPLKLEFPWGSTIEAKSAEHPESLLGEGLDWLIFDECASCKQSIWELYLRPTLSDRLGWALFISTPKGYNWVYDLWKRGNDPEYPEWERFKSPSWKNPKLSPEDIAEAKRTMSQAAFQQEYGADFTLAAGQVYSDFDETIHVLPSTFQIDPGWERFRSIDFGYENPFACLYMAVDPDDRVYIYREYYERHKTVERHAENLNAMGGSYEYTTCDPSGASARATLLENGIPTLAVQTNVLKGLEAVRQQLRIREDQKPGLYVLGNCTETIKEFNLYSYDEKSDKEEPVKEHDHSMDALRYFIVQWRRGYVVQTTGKYN